MTLENVISFSDLILKSVFYEAPPLIDNVVSMNELFYMDKIPVSISRHPF